MTPTIRRPFGANAFGVTAGPQSLGKPPAVYPGAVATDSDLMIAVDRQQTRLALPMSTTDTSMTVIDPSVIVAYCLLTIDAETVKVTGPAVGNVVPVSRAFDGSTAAVHLASAVVSGFVDAYHHNRLVAEVEAIQQTLGANLSRIPASPLTVSSNFNFACQTPGGNLLVGNNVINLAPVPPGVNGSDQKHYLYITGGTGTAEAVLITGGSAVSGAPSGTLFVNCAHTHSGAWTICSATAGIQEALNTFTAAGTVTIPAGTFSVQGPIAMSKNGQWLIGAGALGTTLNASWTAGPVIDTTPASSLGVNNGLRGFTISGASGSNYGIFVNHQNSMNISNLIIVQVGGGIRGVGGDTYRVLIDDVNISYFTGTAFSLEDGGEWILTRCTCNALNSPATIGIFVGAMGGLFVSQSDFIQTNVGLSVRPADGQFAQWAWFTDALFDTSITSGIYFAPTGTGKVFGWTFVNCWCSTSSGTSGGDNGTGAVLGNQGTIDGIRFIGHRFVNNNAAGLIVFGGSNLVIDSSLVAGNNRIGASNSGIAILPAAKSWTVRNSIIGQSDGFANSQTYGIAIAGGGAPDPFAVENNLFGPNITGAIQNASSSTRGIIRNNLGYNPVGQTAVSVGASPFTYTAGLSPEVIYITGGTVSNIKVGSTTVAAASPAQLALAPNQAITVTYSAAPAMVRDVQ